MVYKLFANLDTKQGGQQYDNSPFTKLWLTGSFYEFSNIYGNILVDPTGIQKADSTAETFWYTQQSPWESLPLNKGWLSTFQFYHGIKFIDH